MTLTAAVAPPLTAQPRPTRRRFLRAIGGGLALPAVGAAYATQIELFWPEFPQIELPVRGLPLRFDGLRIAHLTDLHVSSAASFNLVQGVIRKINQEHHDLVMVTGDLVTQAKDWPDQACSLVNSLRAPTYVSLGNHDYGSLNYDGRRVDKADKLQELLERGGKHVLRNATVALHRGDQFLYLAGLEDLWSGRFAPAAALAGVPAGSTVIAMSHNPDTVLALDHYDVSLVLAGHTHGGQLRIPGWGAVMLPVQSRNLQQGLFKFQNTRLYVSRGIGYLLPARFACRPEVPTFVLRSATN